ncbi:hypothetical protein IR117_03885, partial [Streptococcus danieliae]|nr:hypothetical protein [Streptococcus danieliae]
SQAAEKCDIIAVTKYVDARTTRKLVEETGFHHLGESRVPQFLAKKEELEDLSIRWHFIGSLQRRKVKDVINQIDYFHALDSISLARDGIQSMEIINLINDIFD